MHNGNGVRPNGHGGNGHDPRPSQWQKAYRERDKKGLAKPRVYCEASVIDRLKRHFPELSEGDISWVLGGMLHAAMEPWLLNLEQTKGKGVTHAFHQHHDGSCTLKFSDGFEIKYSAEQWAIEQQLFNSRGYGSFFTSVEMPGKAKKTSFTY